MVMLIIVELWIWGGRAYAIFTASKIHLKKYMYVSISDKKQFKMVHSIYAKKKTGK